MIGRGRALPDDVIKNILSLLLNSEMTTAEIAERNECSRSTVLSINRKFKIRKYTGQRNGWILFPQPTSSKIAKNE